MVFCTLLQRSMMGLLLVVHCAPVTGSLWYLSVSMNCCSRSVQTFSRTVHIAAAGRGSDLVPVGAGLDEGGMLSKTFQIRVHLMPTGGFETERYRLVRRQNRRPSARKMRELPRLAG